MKTPYDILIVGGGLVGTTLAIALKNSPWKIGLVEAQIPSFHPQATQDMRALALALSSETFLEQLAIWPFIKQQATPIEYIHVSQQGAFGSSLLKANDNNIDAFGRVISVPILFNALQDKLKTSNCDLLRPAQVTAIKQIDNLWHVTVNDEVLTATLVIACDGSDSFIRKALNLKLHQDHYEQSAIVTNVALSKSHQNTAYERFTKTGSIALLPQQNQRATMVWVLPTDVAEKTLALNDNDFLRELQKTFGYRAGKFLNCGKKQSYPLSHSEAEKQTLPGLIFLGNSAHTMHPIAAQGLNLSLRDAKVLADLLGTTTDLNDGKLLTTYLNQREKDQQSTLSFTDNLQKLFSKQAFPLPFLRSVGLQCFDLLPLLKRRFAKRRMGQV